MQRFGVVVHDFCAKKNLKIAEHVRNQESEENQAGYRHDGLLADRGFVKSRHFRQLRISKYSAHGNDCRLSILADKRIIVTEKERLVVSVCMIAAALAFHLDSQLCISDQVGLQETFACSVNRRAIHLKVLRGAIPRKESPGAYASRRCGAEPKEERATGPRSSALESTRPAALLEHAQTDQVG